jgi:hypothetical protein
MVRVGVALAAVACLAVAPPVAARDGREWRLAGESRARLEFLGNQFRAGLDGGDQALALRTLVALEHRAGPLAVGIEFQDSRHHLDDDGSFLSTSQVAAADVLQAHVRLEAESAAGGGSLVLGRQTLDIGSRRQLERVEFANVILNYTGVHGQWRAARDTWHVVYVVPVAKLPGDFESLRRNRLELDREQWSRRIGALHWIRRQAWPDSRSNLQIEAYAYTLDEDDSRRFRTPNRHYVTPGLRLFVAPAPGGWDAEVEAAWRFGNRRASDRPEDVRPLKVRARTIHAHLGYTFDTGWQPRVGIDWDYASGDRDPTDGRFDQYERLFGARRTDLGNTGIHGPLTPANLDAPGLRVEAAPSRATDFRIAVKWARLASARDAWVVARVRDPSGRSGRSIGRSADLRVRHWLLRDRLRLELGASYLALGRFAREAPNATREGDPRYGYVQVTWTF